MVRWYCKLTGLSSAWGRVFFLYGPREHPDRLVSSVIRNLLADRPAPCSHGEQIRDYMSVLDVADGMVALLDSDFEGPCNIACGRPTAIKAIVSRIGELMGKPDLIPTSDGMVATELDSVPGGIGFTASLAQRYGELGYPIVGSPDGLVLGFVDMVRSASSRHDPVLGIVVSEESANYRPEMVWLGEELNRIGLRTAVVKPEEVDFAEDGLWVPMNGLPVRIDVLYRFFELFDLVNVPKSELMLYAAKKGAVLMVPPVKAYLEEKLWMALFHHPVIEGFWVGELGEETFDLLKRTFPRTWILDPRPLPPHAAIPGMQVRGYPIASWETLRRLTQKERQLVVKPSGFSEVSWGSRGVSVGHDMSEEAWGQALHLALDSFENTTFVLQEFHKGAQFNVDYYDFEGDVVKRLNGRARLCPYYYLVDGQARLGGILATICPPDKKLLHGMVDAVMVPCGVKPEGEMAQ